MNCPTTVDSNVAEGETEERGERGEKKRGLAITRLQQVKKKSTEQLVLARTDKQTRGGRAAWRRNALRRSSEIKLADPGFMV
jgi:hypothetical protein